MQCIRVFRGPVSISLRASARCEARCEGINRASAARVPSQIHVDTCCRRLAGMSLVGRACSQGTRFSATPSE